MAAAVSVCITFFLACAIFRTVWDPRNVALLGANSHVCSFEARLHRI